MKSLQVAFLLLFITIVFSVSLLLSILTLDVRIVLLVYYSKLSPPFFFSRAGQLGRMPKEKEMDLQICKETSLNIAHC